MFQMPQTKSWPKSPARPYTETERREILFVANQNLDNDLIYALLGLIEDGNTKEIEDLDLLREELAVEQKDNERLASQIEDQEEELRENEKTITRLEDKIEGLEIENRELKETYEDIK